MTQRNWIAVASAEHARRGRDHRPLGFMQACHGKHAPLKRISGGDRVVYYSPATVFSGTDKLQSFVSIGIVQTGAPYEFDMGNGFVPWRRDVAYTGAHEAPIAPLIERLAFIENPKLWGYKFRFGMFDVGDDDMKLIAQAMKADLKTLAL
ncbi:EVE domain-containing protein [Variovorax sp. OK605]|jgi:hypothetical protein|uniref:EVE domain-containing protein n=1 Tax=unclassified Variovorax TaxID=663243 RepID=UPI0008C96512|nr:MULTISPECIES: EVE domain-containing protein [unclassified Variovorax]SEJ30886.1 EVE domain-containing protein [Variovorax sp. OK202]SFC25381.1 EVE domain-containing protein [Variovorax sp. OK212]SFO78995.1 EVE domain-containing protein [Variovorax sp. OK605]